ncbi:fimbrial protein [Haemophilus influenzae]|uniref:fimbrial protein n=1 Tax=Haemophilus influenzae TaxID=727 RepID=UPI001EF849B0|nr:fimbrial protein [Haemophilus influenzae]
MKKTILALLALGVFGVANADAINGIPRTPIKADQTTADPSGRIPVTRAVDKANQVNGTHAKITVKGEVLNQTCEIVGSDRDKTVTLAKVGVNQLKKSGDVAADQLIQIKLNNCETQGATTGAAATAGTGAVKVTVTFNASDKIDNYNDGTLINQETGTDGAKFVNIQFANLDGTSIRLGTNDINNKLSPVSSAKGGEHVIEFLARYFATGQATAGKVKGEAELDLAYE